MPRSSQLAANDPQSRSPAASNAACISGARTKAKPSRPIVSAIAAKKSVIRTSPIQASLMWSCPVQFHPGMEPVSTPEPECELGHTRMVQFQINARHTAVCFTSMFSLQKSISYSINYVWLCTWLILLEKGAIMKSALARHSRPKVTIAAAAARGPAAILAAIMLGITASPARADCNPAGRIDASCYSNLQDATTAAIAANEPLWLPAGTYVLNQELVIDYAPLAASSFQIIPDGAIIDATGTGQRAMSIECSGGTPDNPKSCFYFHIQGTLFVNADTSQAAVRFGQNDYSDAHNSAKTDHLVVNNGGSGYGLRLNYVLNANIFVGAAGSAGLVMNQVQFSSISGAASATQGTAILIENGYTFANTFQGLDLEVAQTCLTITSPY